MSQKVTLAEAKALGFNSTKGITKEGGMYKFAPSLGADKGGFKPVDVAKSGEVQMRPYTSDVTGPILTQAEFGEIYKVGTDPQLAANKIQELTQQKTIDELIAGGLSPQLARLRVLGTSGLSEIGQATGQTAKDARDTAAAQAERERQGTSAYALLLAEFNKYGLGALVSPLQDLIKQGLSAGEFSLALQNTDAYKRRFAANTDRIAKGLSALSPAEYIGLEDQYQNIMRNYGLPASYYTKGDLGIQEGFNKLISNDVSATELEDRVMTAQSRVINASPEIKQALRSFYPDITDGDILAYTLDPNKALTDIKRKVTAAEIGGAAIGQGLGTSRIDAEYLGRYGVTKDQAQRGYSAIAEFLPTGEKLSQIYQESPYTQAQAEQEIFNLADSAEAAKRRKKLSTLETGSFSGSSGTGAGSLSRDRAMSNQTFGAGSY
jgi:hypothetical protein